LHLPPRFSATLPRCLLLPALAGHPPPPPLFLNAGAVLGGMGPVWTGKTARENRLHAQVSGHPVRLDIRTLASPF